jgi:hypothetical protein
MAINNDPDLVGRDSTTMHPPGSSMMDRDSTTYDRETRVYDRDTGGSNFLAFLIGGLVIAIGLLAFLFYDGGGTTGDVTTTGSTTPRIESPASPNPPASRPAAPSAPSGAPATAPSNPQ